MKLNQDIDETKNAINTCDKTAEHNEIARQTSEFITRGGAIKQIAIGASAHTDATKQITNEFDGSNHYATVQRSSKRGVEKSKRRGTGIVFDGRNRTKQQSKHGQNINARKNSFVVVIGATVYGTGQGWAKEQAIAERDKIRYTLNMPAAHY